MFKIKIRKFITFVLIGLSLPVFGAADDLKITYFNRSRSHLSQITVSGSYGGKAFRINLNADNYDLKQFAGEGVFYIDKNCTANLSLTAIYVGQKTYRIWFLAPTNKLYINQHLEENSQQSSFFDSQGVAIDGTLYGSNSQLGFNSSHQRGLGGGSSHHSIVGITHVCPIFEYANFEYPYDLKIQGADVIRNFDQQESEDPNQIALPAPGRY